MGMRTLMVKKCQIPPLWIMTSSVTRDAAGGESDSERCTVAERTIRQEAGQKSRVKYVAGSGIIRHPRWLGREIESLIKGDNVDSFVASFTHDDRWAKLQEAVAALEKI